MIETPKSMSSFKILVLPGDHVGPEVLYEAIKVLKIVESQSEARFELTFDLAGGCSIDKHGLPITDQVLEEAKESDAVLFGSVGGPEWHVPVLNSLAHSCPYQILLTL